jgi:hypothetical protein
MTRTINAYTRQFSILMRSSLTNIGWNSFGVSDLTNITIPDSVTWENGFVRKITLTRCGQTVKLMVARRFFSYE